MRELVVKKNDANQRLDKFLLKKFKTMPKKMAYMYIRKKCVKLNGKKATRISKIDTGMQCQALYVKGKKIYYLVTGTEDNVDKEMYLYKMNKKGEKITKVCKIDSNVKEVNMQKDAIYYTTVNDYENFTIKTIKYNGTDKKIIKKVKASDNLNIIKKWVITNTLNEDYDTVLQLISKDGKKEKNL